MHRDVRGLVANTEIMCYKRHRVNFSSCHISPIHCPDFWAWAVWYIPLKELGKTPCLSSGELSKPLIAPSPRDVRSWDWPQAHSAVTQMKEKKRLEEWVNVPDFCFWRPSLLQMWKTHHKRNGFRSHHLGFSLHISIKSWRVIYLQ